MAAMFEYQGRKTKAKYSWLKKSEAGRRLQMNA
jgi:hypothetical protein